MTAFDPCSASTFGTPLASGALMTVALVAPLPPVVPRKSLADLVAREKARKSRRHVAWGVATLALVAVLVATWAALRPRAIPLAARFRVDVVSRGDVVRDVRATGHLEAVTTVLVGAEISGRIATVEVDYNDVVHQGQVLARFDRTALGAQFAQNGATLAAAKAAFEQARTDRRRRPRTTRCVSGRRRSLSLRRGSGRVTTPDCGFSTGRDCGAFWSIKAYRTARRARSNVALPLVYSGVGGNNRTTNAGGASPGYFTIHEWGVSSGRLMSLEYEQRASMVCVVGQTIVDPLFNGGSPLGKRASTPRLVVPRGRGGRVEKVDDRHRPRRGRAHRRDRRSHCDGPNPPPPAGARALRARDSVARAPGKRRRIRA